MKLIEIFYWLLIALCPIIASSIISFFIWNLSESLLWCIITEGCGILAGIYLAEYIIGKTKCPKFQNKMSKKFDMTKIRKAVQMTAFSIVVLKSV